MPGFDGTGPVGQGSFTGRGRGYCIKPLDNNPKINNEDTEKGVIKMPGGDGTGPQGMGPRTGRAAGYCTGNNVPGYVNPYGGRYFGSRRGMFGWAGQGRGYRNWYYATGAPGWRRSDMGFTGWGGVPENPFIGADYPPNIAPEEEMEILKEQAGLLKHQLDDIQSKIEELKKGSKKKVK